MSKEWIERLRWIFASLNLIGWTSILLLPHKDRALREIVDVTVLVCSSGTLFLLYSEQRLKKRESSILAGVANV